MSRTHCSVCGVARNKPGEPWCSAPPSTISRVTTPVDEASEALYRKFHTQGESPRTLHAVATFVLDELLDAPAAVREGVFILYRKARER